VLWADRRPGMESKIACASSPCRTSFPRRGPAQAQALPHEVRALAIAMAGPTLRDIAMVRSKREGTRAISTTAVVLCGSRFQRNGMAPSRRHSVLLSLTLAVVSSLSPFLRLFPPRACFPSCFSFSLCFPYLLSNGFVSLKSGRRAGRAMVCDMVIGFQGGIKSYQFIPGADPVAGTVDLHPRCGRRVVPIHRPQRRHRRFLRSLCSTCTFLTIS